MAAKSTDVGLHESNTRSMRLIEKITGSHRFKVVDYSLQKWIGVGNLLASSIFTIGGYDWVIQYYPNGDTEKNKDYIAFYVSLNSDIGIGTDVNVRLNLTMLDQGGNPTELSKTSVNTFTRNAMGWGYTDFIERKLFEASKYLKSDSFELMCTITVLKHSLLSSTEFEPLVVPPCNLGEQLCHLLESGKGADVTFEVRGEFFKAHKVILAARSPVFSAQFFGLMSEIGAESIKMDDIEPEVLRGLLDFIYSDSIPKFDDDKMESIILYQHLLVAADRYEVERLKVICENKLSQNIKVNNLATSLTLAEQHNCSILKTSCLNSVSSLEILAEVMKTDGYEHMAQSCPNLLLELVENLRIKK